MKRFLIVAIKCLTNVIYFTYSSKLAYHTPCGHTEKQKMKVERKLEMEIGIGNALVQGIAQN